MTMRGWRVAIQASRRAESGARAGPDGRQDPSAKNKPRRSCVAIALLSLVLAGAGCRDEGNSPVASAELVNMPADQVIYNLNHFMTADGIRKAHLRADTAYFHEDSATMRMRTVHMTVHDEQGREQAVVTAEGGWLDSRSELMMAWGNVVVVAQDQGKRIETQELHFDPRGDRIWSTVPTVLRESGRTIRGSGFESDGQLRNVRVTDARSEGVMRF